jgi:hypothetical protein
LISYDLNYIAKGMHQAELLNTIDLDPEESFMIKHQDMTISIDVYKMLYNQYSTTSSYTDSKGNRSTTRVTHVLTMPFAMMYVNGKLHNAFWIADVKKQEDFLTQEVAISIANKYLEITELD